MIKTFKSLKQDFLNTSFLVKITKGFFTYVYIKYKTIYFKFKVIEYITTKLRFIFDKLFKLTKCQWHENDDIKTIVCDRKNQFKISNTNITCDVYVLVFTVSIPYFSDKRFFEYLNFLPEL